MLVSGSMHVIIVHGIHFCYFDPLIKKTFSSVTGRVPENVDLILSVLFFLDI